MRSKCRGGLVAACLLLTGTVGAEDLAMFDGSAIAPFGLFVGDKKGWSTAVLDTQTVSNGGYLTVESDPDSSAKIATWNGKSEAQLYLASPEPQDYSAAAEADAALVVLLQVKTPPRRSTTLRMGCGHPCSANADIGKLLKALPIEEWVRVSFDLKCFIDGGLDITNVDTPFLLLTRDKMSLAIADIRFVDGVGGDATIKCR